MITARPVFTFAQTATPNDQNLNPTRPKRPPIAAGQHAYKIEDDQFIVKRVDSDGRTIHGDFDMAIDVRTKIIDIETLIEPEQIANTAFFIDRVVNVNKYTMSMFLASINAQCLNKKCNAPYPAFYYPSVGDSCYIQCSECDAKWTMDTMSKHLATYEIVDRVMDFENCDQYLALDDEFKHHTPELPVDATTMNTINYTKSPHHGQDESNEMMTKEQYDWTNMADLTSDCPTPIKASMAFNSMHVTTFNNQKTMKENARKLKNAGTLIIVPIINKGAARTVERHYHVVICTPMDMPELLAKSVDFITTEWKGKKSDVPFHRMDFAYCHLGNVNEFIKSMQQDKLRFDEETSAKQRFIEDSAMMHVMEQMKFKVINPLANQMIYQYAIDRAAHDVRVAEFNRHNAEIVERMREAQLADDGTTVPIEVLIVNFQSTKPFTPQIKTVRDNIKYGEQVTLFSQLKGKLGMELVRMETARGGMKKVTYKGRTAFSMCPVGGDRVQILAYGPKGQQWQVEYIQFLKLDGTVKLVNDGQGYCSLFEAQYVAQQFLLSCSPIGTKRTATDAGFEDMRSKHLCSMPSNKIHASLHPFSHLASSQQDVLSEEINQAIALHKLTKEHQAQALHNVFSPSSTVMEALNLPFLRSSWKTDFTTVSNPYNTLIDSMNPSHTSMNPSHTSMNLSHTSMNLSHTSMNPSHTMIGSMNPSHTMIGSMNPSHTRMNPSHTSMNHNHTIPLNPISSSNHVNKPSPAISSSQVKSNPVEIMTARTQIKPTAQINSDIPDITLQEIVDSESGISRSEAINLRINQLTGNPIQLAVSSKFTIAYLKNLLIPRTKVKKELQRILLNGRPLQNNHTLEYYKVTQDTPLLILKKLGGGGPANDNPVNPRKMPGMHQHNEVGVVYKVNPIKQAGACIYPESTNLTTMAMFDACHELNVECTESANGKTSSFIVCAANVNGKITTGRTNQSLEYFKTVMIDQDADLFGLIDTRASKAIPPFYKPIVQSHKRIGSNVGGMAILLNNPGIKPIPICATPFLVAVELSTTTAFACIYVTDGIEHEDAMSDDQQEEDYANDSEIMEMRRQLIDMHTRYDQIHVIGDFNYKQEQHSNPPMSINIIALLQELKSMHVFLKTQLPSYEPSNGRTPSNIDHIYSTHPDNCMQSDIIQANHDYTDHNILITTLIIPTGIILQRPPRWRWNAFKDPEKIEKFKIKLEEVFYDADKIYDLFDDILGTEDIEEQRALMHQVHVIIHCKYNVGMNEVVGMLCAKISNLSKSKQYSDRMLELFKLDHVAVRHYLSLNRSGKIHHYKLDALLKSAPEISHQFARRFKAAVVNPSTLQSVNIQRDKGQVLEVFNQLEPVNIEEILANCSNTGQGLKLMPFPEYLELVAHLTNNKSPGKSGIQFEAFKHSPMIVLKLIYEYFQVALDTGVIPVDWQVCLLHLLFKNGKDDTGDTKNHRPLSLSECMRRLFTKCVKDSLVGMLPVDIYQMAYKLHHSVFDLGNVLGKQIEIYKAITGKDPMVVQSDIHGAFDWMGRGFVLKAFADVLKHINTVRLMHYLLDNKLQLRMGNVLSDLDDTSNGAIQGGTLSPIVFTFCLYVCFKDRPDSMNFLTALLKYSDDLQHCQPTTLDIGAYLTEVDAQLAPANLHLSYAKTVIICKQGTPLINCPPDVKITSEPQKITGQMMDHQGPNAQAHIIKTSKKFYPKIALAAKSGFFYSGLFSKTKLDIFFTHINPIIEYFQAFYPNDAIVKQVQKMRMKGLRIATDTTSQVPDCLIMGLLYQPDIFVRLLYLYSRMMYSTQTKFPEAFEEVIAYVAKERIYCTLPDGEGDLPEHLLSTLLFRYMATDNGTCPICHLPHKGFQRHMKKCAMSHNIQAHLRYITIEPKTPKVVHSINERYTQNQLDAMIEPPDALIGYADLFTDGSREYQDGYAFYYRDQIRNTHHIAHYAVEKGGPAINHIGRIETIAALMALKYIKDKQMDVLNTTGVQIWIDATTAISELEDIKKGAVPSHYDWARLSGIDKQFLNHPNLKIRKVDAHTGVYGNEVADHYAKLASNDSNTPVHPLERLLPEPVQSKSQDMTTGLLKYLGITRPSTTINLKTFFKAVQVTLEAAMRVMKRRMDQKKQNLIFGNNQLQIPSSVNVYSDYKQPKTKEALESAPPNGPFEYTKSRKLIRGVIISELSTLDQDSHQLRNIHFSSAMDIPDSQLHLFVFNTNQPNGNMLHNTPPVPPIPLNYRIEDHIIIHPTSTLRIDKRMARIRPPTDNNRLVPPSSNIPTSCIDPSSTIATRTRFRKNQYDKTTKKPKINKSVPIKRPPNIPQSAPPSDGLYSESSTPGLDMQHGILMSDKIETEDSQADNNKPIINQWHEPLSEYQNQQYDLHDSMESMSDITVDNEIDLPLDADLISQSTNTDPLCFCVETDMEQGEMDECDQLIMDIDRNRAEWELIQAQNAGMKIMQQLDPWMLIDSEDRMDGLAEEETDAQLDDGNVYDLLSNSDGRDDDDHSGNEIVDGFFDGAALQRHRSH